jgi:hypothetical protein
LVIGIVLVATKLLAAELPPAIFLYRPIGPESVNLGMVLTIFYYFSECNMIDFGKFDEGYFGGW